MTNARLVQSEAGYVIVAFIPRPDLRALANRHNPKLTVRWLDNEQIVGEQLVPYEEGKVTRLQLGPRALAETTNGIRVTLPDGKLVSQRFPPIALVEESDSVRIGFAIAAEGNRAE